MTNSSRKNKSDIIRDIQQTLRSGERSIKKLADDIGSQWVTVRDTLDLLKELDVVNEKTIDGERVFFLTRTRETDTLFRLPISKKDRHISSYLFGRIVKEWQKIRGTRPSKTQVQKAAVKIVERENLPVSYGWYLYGQTLSLQYREGKNYDVPRPRISKKVEITIIEVVKEESKKTPRKAVLDNHEKHPVYKNKDCVEKLLHYADLDEENREQVEAFLYEMEQGIRKNNLDLRELFSYFTSVCNRLLHSKTNLNDIRQYVVDAFDETWKVIAGNYYFVTRQGPIISVVNIEDRLAERVLDAELAIAKLEEFLPKKTTRPSEVLKLVGSSPVKFMSPEEKKKAFAELEKDSTDIFRRHNLNGSREI